MFEDWDAIDFDFKNQLPLLTSLKANLSWAENSLHNLSNLNTLMLDAYNENIALGGINKNNLKKIKMVNCNGFAGIKYFKNE